MAQLAIEERGDVATDPLVGTPYAAGQVLGRGSMGIVYAAEHRRLRKQVCVKVLMPWLSRHPELVDRMRMEAQALASLDEHPNLLLVSDFGETPSGQPYLVTERLHGHTLLEERRRRGELPVAEAIDLVCQALAGLAVAHAHGIVHRDIKPGNLFVCDPRGLGERRVLKVLDFGIVKIAAAGAAARTVAPLAFPTEEGVSVGTPKYFAPEQALGMPADHRADLYSLGIVLYTMVAGRGPFDHRSTVLDLTRAAVEERPKAPSAYATQAIPRALDAILLRALAKSPSDRFQDADEFAAALRRVSTSAPRWERTDVIDVDGTARTLEAPTRRRPPPLPYLRTIPIPTLPEAPMVSRPAPIPPIEPAPTAAVRSTESTARPDAHRRARTRLANIAIAVFMGTMAGCLAVFLFRLWWSR